MNRITIQVIITFGALLLSAGALAEKPMSFFDLHANRLDGKDQPLSEYKGKVVLVVNTASECGFTPQYQGLQKISDELGPKGVVVLGFPSNEFGGQEPGSNDEI